MKILVTGFEPFGGSNLNPSQQVVQVLTGQTINGAKLMTRILPVDGQRGPYALLEALHDCQPDRVLCLGEATRRPALSIERMAINLLDYRIPDNSGQQVIDEPVIPGGPAAYFTTFPARKIYNAMVEAGVPTELSLSAGAFLCNQVLYHLLHHLAIKGLKIQAGFIHLPPLPQQVANQPNPLPSMSLDTSVTGVRAAIAMMADHS